MAGRTIEVSGIPFIPDEQPLLDFLEVILGNGGVRTCRIMQSNGHESSSSSCSETEGDRQVRAIVETESAESAIALHKLAKARILEFWYAELAVKFLSFPDPDYLSSPDLNTGDFPSDPEMSLEEHRSSTDYIPVEPDVDSEMGVHEQRSFTESKVGVHEQRSFTGAIMSESDIFVSKVEPDINYSEPKQLSDPRLPGSEVFQEIRPKFYLPAIFQIQSPSRPKKPEPKVVCEPEILSERNHSVPKDLSEPRLEMDEKLGTR